jgi:hypothetical protein
MKPSKGRPKLTPGCSAEEEEEEEDISTDCERLRLNTISRR